MMRIAQVLTAAALIATGAACTRTQALADTEANSAAIRCGNKGPYYGRTDGLCLDTDTKAPGTVVNGVFDSMAMSSLYVAVEADFVGDTVIPDIGSVDGSQGPWVTTNTNQGGGGALQVGDADDGVQELAIDNGNEVGDSDLNWGNEQNIDSDTEPFCVFRINIPTIGAAADTFAWGLYSAQNDLVDSTANNAYFGVAGADLTLDTASDDASTDVNNTGTGVTLTAGTWYEFMVSLNSMHGRTVSDPDGASATDVHFFYRSTLGGDWTQLNAGTTHSIGADIALQPFVHVEKTSGTTTPAIRVDYIKCYWERS